MRAARLLKLGDAINKLARLSPKLAGQIALQLFIRPRRIPFRPDAQALLAEADRVETPNYFLDLAGYTWGEPDGRPRVLLIHGWESHTGRWVTIVRELVARGAQVLAFDGPAAGNSSGRKAAYNTYVDAALAFERAHGPFDAYIGHSFGGGVVAQLLARTRPERRPESAVIMGAFDEAEHVFDRYFDMLGMDARVRASFDARIHKLVGGEEGVRSYSNTAALKDMGLVRGLVVHSVDDSISPVAEGERLHAAWPAAELLLFDKHGHALRHVDVETAVVDWVVG